MEQCTTYTLRALTRASVWVFKYDLNGIITEVNFLKMGLTEKQLVWLFKDGNFPYKEQIIKDWKLDKKLFEIIVGDADLSFEALWKLYDHKIAKFHAEKAFKPLKDETKVKLFISIPKYLKYLQISKVGQAHLATYINGRYYENEYK
jgi:hypothetical protein